MAAEHRTPDISVDCREAIGSGLMGILAPVVQEIESKVTAVKASQLELQKVIDDVSEDLKKIEENQPKAMTDLDTYTRKMVVVKGKVLVINDLLKNTQDRLKKLHDNVSKHVAKKRAQLDTQTDDLFDST